MVRAAAFSSVGGFNSNLGAGEEPELCVRLRRAGWKLLRLDCPMAWHDAGMTRLDQWWTRAVRSGQAYAQGTALHGRSAERHNVRECLSAWWWAAVLPIVVILVVTCVGRWAWLTLLLWPLQVARIAIRRKRQDESRTDAWLYGLFCMIAKWPELYGQLLYWLKHSRQVTPPSPSSASTNERAS